MRELKRPITYTVKLRVGKELLDVMEQAKKLWNISCSEQVATCVRWSLKQEIDYSALVDTGSYKGTVITVKIAKELSQIDLRKLVYYRLKQELEAYVPRNKAGKLPVEGVDYIKGEW